MRLLSTYKNLYLADLDRQLLALKNIPTTFIASDGRVIEKWLDYENNLDADLSGSLYVEDNIFDRASRVYRKMDRKRNRSQFFITYILPIILFVVTWSANVRMSEKAKELLLSFNIPIKYTGAFVYCILLVFEIKDFIKKWWVPSDKYKKIEIGKVEFQKEVRSIVTKLFIATVLFVTAYLLF